MKGLRAYYKGQLGGDQRLKQRILDVLVPTRSSYGGVPELRPAKETYFGSDWSGSSAVEQLYGPFGRSEFLAVEPPEDADRRDEERAFLKWVGVAEHPRVLEEIADHRGAYKVDKLDRHPHRVCEIWDLWWNSEEVRDARACSQGHPKLQQLRESHVLDRFGELVESCDPRRMLILWQELAQQWSTVYEGATHSVFSCQNQGHRGQRNRHSPSLFHHMLVETSWVPALKGSERTLVRPDQAWRLTPETPKSVAKRVPVLDNRMVDGAGNGFAVAMNVTDAARPSPRVLAQLLEDLRTEYELSAEQAREIRSASRWAMRTLNKALSDPKAEDVTGVSLLAKHRGEPVFVCNPVVARDPLLADAWEEDYPILDADDDLHRLHDELKLRVLDNPDSGVAVSPVLKAQSETICVPRSRRRLTRRSRS